MNYDIIGDIHGHADALEALLARMGYRQRHGSWSQPGHTAIFVGDYIDRGPRQRDSVNIVRSMVDAGAAHAVMGNHEFNAVAWSLPDPDHAGAFMRPHSQAKQAQHQAFLDATADKPAVRAEILDWFLSLPLWLQLPDLRVVHACWDEDSMAVLEPMLDARRCLDVAGVRAASRRGSAESKALECVLKGPEIKLPNGIEFPQGDQLRSEARIRWWKADTTGLRDAALVDKGTVAKLPDTPIAEEIWPRYDERTPIFIGHYWMRGTPEPLTPRIACLDFSVAKDGPLVGYRWQGERDLQPEHFVQVRGGVV